MFNTPKLQPPPAPRIRSKMDSLFFMPDTLRGSGSEGIAPAKRDHQVSEPQSKIEDIAKEPEVQVEIENVERPVDLYKVL